MNTDGYVLKDSGERQEFVSGMVRDVQDGKVDFSTVFNGPMLERWAVHLTKGAVKYPDAALGVPNWMLAEGNEERIRFQKSAVRHFVQWLRGDTDEDHASAVFFNINGDEYVKGKMEAQPLQPEPPTLTLDQIRDIAEITCPLRETGLGRPIVSGAV